jgi:monoamine oxidase
MDAPISRREFVTQGAAAATLAALGCASPSPEKPGAPARVIVAGAGLAGLAAAYELVGRGHDVTVLEARRRPGGRVLTLRDGFDDGLYAEAGAAFIPEDHVHTIAYARDLGVTLVPAGAPGRGKDSQYFVGGRTVSLDADHRPDWPLDLRPDEAGRAPGDLLARYLGPALDRLGDPRHPSWPGPQAMAYDDETLAQLLRRQGASEAAVRLVRLGYLDEWGDGIDACSALFLLRDMALRPAGGTVYRIEGGTDRLPHAFATRLGTRIRYGAVVREIRHDPDGVHVGFEVDGGVETASADFLVCAIPFTTLRSVRVSPPFPPGKRRAIHGLRTTSVARVYLQLRSRCWSADAASVATDLPIMLAADATAGQGGTRAILEAFVTGAQARALTAMAPDERVRFALDHLGRIHPAVPRLVEQGTSWCWDADPWALGDYAWFAPGEMRAFLPHLAEPVGRIHFAGDHTSAWPGWMQGALASGIRAADEVHAASTGRT